MTSPESVLYRVLAMAGLLLTLAPGAIAEGLADKVTINDPYVRAVPPVVKTSAAFLQLQNTGTVEGLLVAASSPAAAEVELHIHHDDGGIMRMRRIPHVHLPPGETVSLAPGGQHVMLFGLVAPLVPGDKMPLRLTFDDGSSKDVTALVRGTTPH